MKEGQIARDMILAKAKASIQRAMVVYKMENVEPDRPNTTC